MVQVFPSISSLLRLAGAVLSEKDEDWSTRRYFKDSSILKAFEKRKPEPKPVDMSMIEEKAEAILAIAKDENVVIGRRAA